jgi:acetylornithine deacetylase/succinyl-diaminopimelate desuccinylase-like protein
VPQIFVSQNIKIDLSRYNVIAQTKGGDQNNVLLAGAHTDSVKAGAF